MTAVSNTCGICLSPYSAEHPAVSVQGPQHLTNHLFHPDCIQNWIATQRQVFQQPSCPLCRRHITYIGNTQSPSVIPDHISESINMAILNGDVALVQNILARNRPIPRINLDVGIAIASNRNDIDMVRALLGHISTNARGLSAIDCARSGHRESLYLLLSVGPILSYHRGKGILCAIPNNDEESIRCLLDNGSISIIDRILAVWKARQAGHENIVSLLCEDSYAVLIKVAIIGLDLLMSR